MKWKAVILKSFDKDIMLSNKSQCYMPCWWWVAFIRTGTGTGEARGATSTFCHLNFFGNLQLKVTLLTKGYF